MKTRYIVFTVLILLTNSAFSFDMPTAVVGLKFGTLRNEVIKYMNERPFTKIISEKGNIDVFESTFFEEKCKIALHYNKNDQLVMGKIYFAKNIDDSRESYNVFAKELMRKYGPISNIELFKHLNTLSVSWYFQNGNQIKLDMFTFEEYDPNQKGIFTVYLAYMSKEMIEINKKAIEELTIERRIQAYQEF